LLAQLPDLYSDASTESKGGGDNTDDDLSELEELLDEVKLRARTLERVNVYTIIKLAKNVKLNLNYL